MRIKRFSALVLCVLMALQLFGCALINTVKSDPDSVGILTFTMQDPDTGEWTTVGER